MENLDNRIGFVGLGLMGRGMSENLLRKGYPLSVLGHLKRENVEALAALGAREMDSPKALAMNSDIVILCVTGTPQVEEVVLGADGVLAGARPGLMVIDCSTSEPASTLKIAARLAEKGAVLVDAPLARTPKEAAEGRLNTMVGASEEDFARARPVLAAFCENIFHMGPVGAGHKAKLLNNYITMGQAAMIAEAMHGCRTLDVPMDRFFELVSAGGGNSGIFQMVAGSILSGDMDGLNFAIRNAAKDLTYHNRMREDAGLDAGIGGSISARFVEALDHGLGDRTVGHLFAFENARPSAGRKETGTH
ncbi:NAD(P)-dependent oxidoreductase [Nisaea sediminum]|uniref:NAD(P)-dependent oxidoreductase n=1 Tax=Nisaea sediminum TaxID=2775867 RepID=UPI0018693756|nr:NAD(P)-dependent oxidoreductase [Nisaea sediminum]